MTEFDIKNPDSYNYWTDVSIRFSDQDSNAHVNNTAFTIYAEAGRVDYLQNVRQNMNIDTKAVLASVHLDYINQLFYPGMVRVGTRLSRLGGKSFTLSQALFSDDQLVATSEAVLVFFDYEANLSTAVPDVLRQAFDDGARLTSV